MRVLFFSIVVVGMIGLTIPNAFSEIYVHESSYPFSIQHPSDWNHIVEDEWGGVYIGDTAGTEWVYVQLYCSELRGEDCGQAGADYQEIDFLKKDEVWYCENADMQEHYYTCKDLKFLDEFVHQLDGYRAVTVLDPAEILSSGKDPRFPDGEAGRYQDMVYSTYVLVSNPGGFNLSNSSNLDADLWYVGIGYEADKFDQEEAEKVLSTFMINNVYAQEDIFQGPSWFENLINAIMSIFGGGTPDTSSVIIEIPIVEDPFMNPDIDWDNPIIIDPRFDDLWP